MKIQVFVFEAICDFLNGTYFISSVGLGILIGMAYAIWNIVLHPEKRGTVPPLDDFWPKPLRTKARELIALRLVGYALFFGPLIGVMATFVKELFVGGTVWGFLSDMPAGEAIGWTAVTGMLLTIPCGLGLRLLDNCEHDTTPRINPRSAIAGANIAIYDKEGNLLKEGKSNTHGYFQFKFPKQVVYGIEVKSRGERRFFVAHVNGLGQIYAPDMTEEDGDIVVVFPAVSMPVPEPASKDDVQRTRLSLEVRVNVRD